MPLWALLLSLLLFACNTPQPVVVVAKEPQGDTWWLRTKFFPSGKALRGHPAAELNASWCAIDELRADLFPDTDEVQAHESGVRDPHATFSASVTLSGQSAEVVLAVYRTCTGDTGTALIAFEVNSSSAAGRSAVLSIQSLGSPAEWATVHALPNGDIEIWWCF